MIKPPSRFVFYIVSEQIKLHHILGFPYQWIKLYLTYSSLLPEINEAPSLKQCREKKAKKANGCHMVQATR